MLLHSNQLTETPAGCSDSSVPVLNGARDASSLSAAIVTMTRARDAVASRTLQRSLRGLSKAGLPVYAGDGGSGPNFVGRIKRLPNVQVCALAGCKPTLVNQLRVAFSEAQEINPAYFLYTEPDKLAFFDRGLQSLLLAARAGDRAPGLVLAARTRRGFATFPEGQRIAEGFMNQVCGEALGQAGDYTYGPMLISQRLAGYLRLAPENLGWGWRFFLMAIAHQLRMRIVLCTVGNECPRAQRNKDDREARDYRLRPLIENVTGLANGWTCLLDQPMEPARSDLNPAQPYLPQ